MLQELALASKSKFFVSPVHNTRRQMLVLKPHHSVCGDTQNIVPHSTGKHITPPHEHDGTKPPMRYPP